VPTFERFARLNWAQGWLWWGLGWRAIAAAAGWVAFFFRLEPTTDQPASTGGPASLQ